MIFITEFIGEDVYTGHLALSYRQASMTQLDPRLISLAENQPTVERALAYSWRVLPGFEKKPDYSALYITPVGKRGGD